MDYTTSVDFKTSGKFKLLAIKLQKNVYVHWASREI